MTTLYQSNEDRGNIFGEVEKSDQQNGSTLEKFARNDGAKTNTIAQEFKAWRQRFQYITSQMGKAQDLDSLLKVTVAQVRDKIGGDRALIYQFTNSDTGTVLVESRTTGWTPSLGENLPAILFGLYTSQDYIEPVTIDDINQIQATPYQKQLLDKFQVKASLSLPISRNNQVWGLLVLHSCGSERQWQEAEITLLSQISTEITYRLQSFKLQKELQQSGLAKKSAAKVISKILQQPDVDKIFQTTTQEVRQLLKCDRVGVYRFEQDWSGKFVSESVGNNWTKVVTPDYKMVWEDTHLQETKGGRYAQGETFVVNDTYKIGLAQCHIDILEQFEAKAYIIAPIFSGEKLWGLLAAYQNTGPREWQDWEVSFLNQIGLQFGVAISQGEYLEKVQKQSDQLAQIAKQEKALTKIVNRIRQSSDLEEIFKTTTQEARQALKCDRVAIYRFNPDWSGNFIAESVATGWVKLVGSDINTLVEDTYFQETKGARFAKGENLWVNDIYQENITPCYLELLETFEAKAYVNVPIFFGDQLWGLLAAYQNSETREWQTSEVNFLTQIALQFNLAKSQIDYLETVRLKNEELAKIAEQEKSINKIVNRIRQARDVDEIFVTTTQEVRQALRCDRVAVYQFHPDWSGKFIAESVASGWIKVATADFKMVWEDSHLQETQGGRYAKGESLAVNNIYQAGHAQCHLEILEQIEAKAYIIVPIFYGEKLWGLLAAYQNSSTREWQTREVKFLEQIGLQFSLAKSQIDYINQVQSQSQEISQIAEQEKTLNKIVNRIRQSFDLEDIFKAATQEVRQALRCDRVAVYQFHPDWSGQFIAESVASGWIKVATADFKMVWEDSHLQETQGGRYAKGESLAVNNIYQAGHAQCHLEILEQIEAKAYIIVPIFYGEKLWGLLAAYQNSSTREWQRREVNFLEQIGLQISLAKSQIDYLEQVKSKSEKLAQIAEQEKAFSKIVNRIRQSSDVEEIFKTTTQEVRQLLKCDRAVVYQFTSDWGGEFVAESVASGWVKLVGPGLKTTLNDPCLQDNEGGRYKKGDALVVNDIYKATLDPCYIEIIEKYEARGYIITPILFGDKLWGLLAAYQNSAPREWDESEINLLSRIGDQLGLALQQTEYLKQLQTQSAQLSEAAQREKAAKELLQQRSIQLLRAISPALSGDLTVRAPITEDELGTIADAYNGTLQALQQIVIQVQTSSQQVAQTSINSSSSLVGLTDLAKEQSDEISQALRDLQQMVDATQAVVANAQLVQMAVQQANKTVDSGDTAMNQTVNAIQAIRETVAQTSKKIKRLSESSQKISKVVNLISNFASQTNVLALNAAIEATRAGEYGKGFAVVADEVRSLSRQSAAATIEIEKLVQEIQAETGEVALAMETGIQQVVEGTNLVSETRQNLNAIVSATAEISQLIERITEATQKQMEQSVTVTTSMNDVASIANKTFGESQEIAAVFQNLSEMAQALLTTAGKFKVK
ncbi:GAF domain-containing protein [Anabaena aphanizomenioides LEGE 00250]|uniref:GAF domain-containing protein n=1 Tax=Sphaerospermopsis aphanizomenoides LEGE 00250 TaxID=2777972 RepID=A0ABR9V7J3_9CYAN|nr:GAF domain-containing protein [Sphaerospermopsis aphanizomenoides]MBE9234475.1 GAF domain-containing protein [Sphaerospermopsis aphanizomenoides LEGE 00250]